MSDSYDNRQFHKFTILDLLLTEGSGPITFDRSKNSMEVLLSEDPPASWSKNPEGIYYINHTAGASSVAQAPNPNKAQNPNTLGLYNNNFTILMYYKLDDNMIGVQSGTLMARESPATGGYIWSWDNQGRLVFETEQAGPVIQTSKSIGGVMLPNVWQFLAVTRDGSVIEFFKDGVKVSKSISGIHIAPGYDPLLYTEIANRIAGISNKICSFQRTRIILRALTEEEIMILYARSHKLMDAL